MKRRAPSPPAAQPARSARRDRRSPAAPPRKRRRRAAPVAPTAPAVQCDVVVVGAGPAGTSAARFLAEEGVSVALIDGERFPRPKPCAGWLADKALQEFPFLRAVRRRIQAAGFKRLVFHSPDLEHTARFTNRATVGHVVLREEFDAALVAAARSAGAETLLGRQVVDLRGGERDITAVLADGRTVTGRILVGADGAGSLVARRSGLRPRWSPEQLVACLSKTVPLTAKQKCACYGAGGEIHVALGFGGASGYAWAFPGVAHVGIGVGVRAADPQRLRGLYEAWVAGLRAKGLLPPAARTDEPAPALLPAGAALEFENHVGKRTLLIGDAGGFVSAASGEGIFPGIRSAAIAVRCILRALAADAGKLPGASSCQDELLAFKHLWRQELAAYLQMPNVNITFLLPLIYANQEIADRFGRAFLLGENL